MRQEERGDIVAHEIEIFRKFHIVHESAHDGRFPEALVEVDPALWSKSFPREERTPDQEDAYAAATWLRQADLKGNLNKFSKPSLLSGQCPIAKKSGDGFWA